MDNKRILFIYLRKQDKRDNIMERKKRRFKRTIKQEQFKEDVKKQMNMDNFKIMEDPLEKEARIAVSKCSKLSLRIKTLPRELQVNIFIITMQNYWKEMTLKTPLRPIWYDSVSYMENQKRKAIFENVHFMHLECNTLEHLKSWIPGCQCDFCLNDTTVENKQEIYRNIYDNGSEFVCHDFEERTHCYDLMPNFWNTYMMLYMGYPFGYVAKMKIFDPLKNQFGDEFKRINEDPIQSPIYFSEEIVSQYN